MNAAKILIVEDQSTTANRISSLLEKYGFIVTAIATSRIEALDAMRQNQADLVLMDILLNGKKEGVITAKEIKALYPVTIIYLTELEDEEIFKEAKATFPKHYISKPWTDADLIHAIELAVQQPNYSVDHLFDQIEPRVTDGIFTIANTSEKVYQKLLFKDILYLEACGPGSYTKIYYENRNKETDVVTITFSSNHVFEQLNYPSIIKIHKSYYVNIQKIEKVQNTDVFVYGKNNPIPVSKEFKDSLNNKLIYLKSPQKK
jgi:DNA-binding LytR/AlgR family response regulator